MCTVFQTAPGFFNDRTSVLVSTHGSGYHMIYIILIIKNMNPNIWLYYSDHFSHTFLKMI